MSEFKPGDKVEWEYMGQTEQGVVMGKHLFHRATSPCYRVGRVVDGGLVEWGFVSIYSPTLRKVDEPAPVTTKVEKLSENLKHLDKPAYLASPHRWTVLAETAKPGISRTTKFWARKVAGGRNKSTVATPAGELGYSNIPYRDLGDKDNFLFVLDCQKSLEGGWLGMYATSGYLFDEGLYQQYMFHRCSDDNGALGVSDTTGNKPYQRKTRNGTARLSRSAFLRWFPALENTTYSDAITLHFSQHSQGGLRATQGFLLDSCLYYRYAGRNWRHSDLRGNKAQTNRYHALKTY